MNRRPIVLALLLLAGLRADGGAAEASTRRFLWEAANARMLQARTPGQFSEAAERYEQLLATGTRNGPLLYNYGTALLKAGRPSDGLRALEAAERYTGRHEEVQRNMLAAVAALTRTPEPSLPWLRLPLYLHYGIGWTTRLTVACAAFLGLWILLSLRALGWRTDIRGWLALCVALCITFGSSAAATGYAEAKARRDIGLRLESPAETSRLADGGGPPS